MFNRWLDDVNAYVEILDEELQNIRKDVFKTAFEMIDIEKLPDNFAKEMGRHKEKARLREVLKDINWSRLLLAKLYFQGHICNAAIILTVIVLIIQCVLRNWSIVVLSAAATLCFIATKVNTILITRRVASNIIDCYISYGTGEAVIKAFDFRGQETIDPSCALSHQKYELKDLI